MAKPPMALPNMDITVPTVIIVKSLVHRDAAGLPLSSIRIIPLKNARITG
jgi:hypothetical protein